jgi:hypothetical protein
VLYWQLTQLGVACEVIAPRVWFPPRLEIALRRTAAMRRNWRAATAPGNSRRCGCRTPRTRPCETWCGLEKVPRRIS